MATGRTVLKHSHVYYDGYDITGFSRSFGPLTWTFGEADATTLGDPVKTAMADVATINVGTINAIMDSTALTGSHIIMPSQAARTVMLPIGIRGTPANGDPVFCGVFMQKDFMHEISPDSIATLSAPFSGWAVDAATLLYNKPWGVLVHAKGVETAVNSSSGIDDRGAQTTAGGFMCYQFFTSNGTATLKVQDSADNSAFADLVSAGSLDASTTPKHGIVALGTTATVRRYLRWQIVLGTATTVTFALSFVRI